MPKSKFYAITGVSTVGKTTTINILASLNYYIIPEVAELIEQEEKIKNPNWKYTDNYLEFINAIIRKQLQLESLNYSGRPVFLDRGLIDCLVYCHFDKQPITSYLLESCNKVYYDKTFLLKPINLRAKKIDNKTIEQVNTIEGLIMEFYSKYCGEIHIIPSLPVEARVDMILKIADLV